MSSADETALLARLRAGDAAAFEELVDAHSPWLLRIARARVQSRATAEEVVQETWLAVLEGLDRFEERSTLKTWLYAIVANIARTRAAREHRSRPFSSFAQEEEGRPSVDPDRFLPADHDRWPGHWAVAPAPSPDERAITRETREVLRDAIAALPEVQRTVISLRDIEGWGSDEVCLALALSEGNQRVVLHRARTKVRAALERHETSAVGPA